MRLECFAAGGIAILLNKKKNSPDKGEKKAHITCSTRVDAVVAARTDVFGYRCKECGLQLSADIPYLNSNNLSCIV